MIKFNNHDPKNLAPLGRLWWIFFAYTASVALMVQFVLLPYVFPAWHAGDGLLRCLDSWGFHCIAIDLAQKIKTLGWAAWQLRPLGQAPAGIAGAMYALTISKPWVLIPINAALHATAALILLCMVQIFLSNWRRALWCVLPFLLYPSAMTWYTQNHKDGYFFAGAFLFLYSWILLAKFETWRNMWWRAFPPLLYILLGSLLVWAVRPYGLELMQGVGVLLVLILSGFFIFSSASGQIAWRKALMGIFMAWVMLVMINPRTMRGISVQALISVQAPIDERKEPSVQAPIDERKESSTVAPIGMRKSSSVEVWKESGILPMFLENKFYALVTIRQGFPLGYPNAGSNIDTDINFHSVWEIFTYLPRAAQIAFFAPFPHQWYERGTIPANTMMRRISAVEMVGIYLALIFLPYAVWHWRCRIELWLVLSFCSGMMLIYAFAVSNVGTLYRFRYGFLMTLVALGIAGFFEACEGLGFFRKRRGTEKNMVNVRYSRLP